MIGAAQPARAQGFQLERYEPTPAGSWFFGVVHPWYSSTRWFAGGFTLDYAHNPLLAGVFDNSGNFHKTAAVVEHMLVGHFDVAASFLDRVQVNASLPVTFMERGTPQFGVSPLDGAKVGDPRLGVFVRLYGQPDRDAFSLSLGGYVWIPIGADKEHQGDKTARGLPELIAAGLIKKHIRYAFNLGVLIRSESSIGFGPGSAGTELQAALGIAYADVERRFQVGPELLFGTVVVGDHAFKNYFTNLDLLLGAQYNIARLINIGAAVGIGTLSELGTPDARVIFRVAYAPIREEKKAPLDTDRDGIIDPEDACPTEPGPRTNNPKTNGCPDRDHDGIPDSEDLCPDQAPGTQPDGDKKGCPVVDADHDGVPDSMDLCPGESGGDHPDPKRPGCPFVDKDNDGVADAEDLCPGDAPGKYPDPKRPGCPLPDADGDGIPDSMDACPDKAGMPQADSGQNGCPKIELVLGKTTELKMVNFEVNKWVLLPESLPVLDSVAKNLNEHQEWRKIRIEGHADDTGTAAWNLRLSKHRAQAVMEYLITKGVKRSRLDYIGYGDTKPLVAEKSDEARAKNRRVEIQILDRK
jgi:outer membrane protein OmpA-like peptidoglycan-associated protein